MSQIQSGVDPTSKPRETGMTVAQAYEAHVSERELRPSTSMSYREHIDKYLRSVRGRAVADLSRQDVRDLFEQLRSRHGQTTAAGAMRTLRAIINTAMRIDETITSNPMVADSHPRAEAEASSGDKLRGMVEAQRGHEPGARRDLHRTMNAHGRAQDDAAAPRTRRRGPGAAGAPLPAHEGRRRDALSHGRAADRNNQGAHGGRRAPQERLALALARERERSVWSRQRSGAAAACPARTNIAT